MRILVTGSRTWTDHKAIRDALGLLPDDTTIVVGYDPVRHQPKGADEITYQVAHEYGLAVECHPADWSLGQRAGMMRTLEMFDYPVPDLVLAFWDGESRGTGFAISTGKRRGIPVHIRRMDEGLQQGGTSDGSSASPAPTPHRCAWCGMDRRPMKYREGDDYFCNADHLRRLVERQMGDAVEARGLCRKCYARHPFDSKCIPWVKGKC